jgi:phosphopantetheine--protein transferase-like protein
MYSIGIDIVEISRFTRLRHLNSVAEQFLTASEMSRAEASADHCQFFASRFAAKEAVIKAVPQVLNYLEFEIIKDGNQPGVNFLNPAFSNYKVALSLSHSEQSAVAVAIVEG